MAQTTKLNRSGLLMVGIAYLGFIALGIPGTLLNIAWAPEHMQKTFAVPIEAYGLLSIAGTIGYFIATFTSGRIISRLGIGTMLLISAIATTIGLIGYAVTPSWATLIVIALIMGVGSGLIDGGLNIYFAANYSPRLMNWLHAFFGVGATVGPWIMTGLITAGQSWRTGYAVVAGIYMLLTGIFFVTRNWWRTTTPTPTSAPVESPAAPKQSRQILLMPAVWIGVALFFAYGGLEVSSGQWAATLFTKARDISAEVAGTWVGLYWGSFTIGRFLFGAFANRLKVITVIRTCMVVAIIGALLLWWSPVAEVGFAGLAILGFAQAPIFPLLVTNTQDRLGPKLAPHAIGFQVGGASIGIAVLPGLAGVLIGQFGATILPPFLLAIAVILVLLYEFSLRSARAVSQAEAETAAQPQTVA